MPCGLIGGVDPWQRQRSLARTTVWWGLSSVGAGLGIAATRRTPWWRAFGLQHAGWGTVDLGIAAGVSLAQNRQMRRLANPYGPVELERQRRRLRRVLLINVVADAGYVAGGIVLWRSRRARPAAAGAGVAIAIQGAFLLLHDGYHARQSRSRTRPVTPE